MLEERKKSVCDEIDDESVERHAMGRFPEPRVRVHLVVCVTQIAH